MLIITHTVISLPSLQYVFGVLQGLVYISLSVIPSARNEKCLTYIYMNICNLVNMVRTLQGHQ